MQQIYDDLNPWWEGRPIETGVPRPRYLSRVQETAAREQIVMVVGGRRVGKTTLMRQIIGRWLADGIPGRDILYLSLDHPGLRGLRLSEHMRLFRSRFAHSREQAVWAVLDEVQESPDWERELKALYDHTPTRMVCTGSTASLIASQGGGLTGRQSFLMVYPLDFAEFLAFRGYSFAPSDSAAYVGAAEEYLQTGGYPGHVLRPSPAYLADLLDDVIARDIVRLHALRRTDEVYGMVRLVAAGIGSRFSYRRMANALGIAVDTARDYLSYLRGAYIVAAAEKWTSSHVERVAAQKKVYFLDTGFKTLLTGRGDLGAKAENAVFVDFLRRGARPGYYAEGEREVDFVVGSPEDPSVVEAKYDDTFDWSDRRLGGVRLFLRRFPTCRRVTVVTREASGELEVGPVRVTAVPLWRYLLRDGDQGRSFPAELLP